jgi:hypothetical protein
MSADSDQKFLLRFPGCPADLKKPYRDESSTTLSMLFEKLFNGIDKLLLFPKEKRVSALE